MKKVRKTIYCPRYNSEISAEKSALLQSATYTLCAEMKLKTKMIHAGSLVFSSLYGFDNVK
jgi:hypothetical protein